MFTKGTHPFNWCLDWEQSILALHKPPETKKPFPILPLSMHFAYSMQLIWRGHLLCAKCFMSIISFNFPFT